MSTATRKASCTFPAPPSSRHGTFGECVLLETLVLSILNHDAAIASAAARMVSAAQDRPLVEMGSRRTHEAGRRRRPPRAAYIAGFAGSSNLEASAATGCLRWAPPRMRSHCCRAAQLVLVMRLAKNIRVGEGRVPRPGRRARYRHDSAGRYVRHHRGWPTPSRWPVPNSGGPHRFR